MYFFILMWYRVLWVSWMYSLSFIIIEKYSTIISWNISSHFFPFSYCASSLFNSVQQFDMVLFTCWNSPFLMHLFYCIFEHIIIILKYLSDSFNIWTFSRYASAILFISWQWVYLPTPHLFLVECWTLCVKKQTEVNNIYAQK